ncbi:MAG: hypothetical protein KDD53_13325, partial [Bdellovibrionales bacterium]|nr:hypothetical protein [Bdellovibrionales bacterium]
MSGAADSTPATYDLDVDEAIEAGLEILAVTIPHHIAGCQNAKHCANVSLTFFNNNGKETTSKGNVRSIAVSTDYVLPLIFLGKNGIKLSATRQRSLEERFIDHTPVFFQDNDVPLGNYNDPY